VAERGLVRLIHRVLPARLGSRKAPKYQRYSRMITMWLRATAAPTASSSVALAALLRDLRWLPYSVQIHEDAHPTRVLCHGALEDQDV
jgi:hypothetical protein